MAGARAAVAAGCAPGERLGAGRAARARWARAAGACGSRASRRARRRCRRTSPSRSRIPERYQTVYARRSRLGRGADGGAPLHARAARSPRRSSASRCTSASTRSARSTAATLEEHELHGERYSVEPARWERIEAAERVLAVGTTTVRVLETVARGGALARPDRALRHARLRVPPRRRAADELPPAALDAARARDGVRRGGGDAAPLRARDRRALPLLLLRRRDARSCEP